MVRITNVIQAEREYIVQTYENKIDFIYLEASNAFPVKMVTREIIKYTHSYKYYTIKDTTINGKEVMEECPRYREPKIQEHIIKCQETRSLRIQLIKNLQKELMKQKLEDIHIDEVYSFINDILDYLEDNNKEDYELN